MNYFCFPWIANLLKIVEFLSAGRLFPDEIVLSLYNCFTLYLLLGKGTMKEVLLPINQQYNGIAYLCQMKRAFEQRAKWKGCEQ
ncbi:MAG: hypothetical protein LUG51_09080 [Tannerellaceae bacterium]|nr:hypothetical protein [Tannerellaceae bacterium]